MDNKDYPKIRAIKELLSAGHKVEFICRKLHVTEEDINNVFLNGFRPVQDRITTDQKMKIRKMIVAGQPMEKIAEKIGIPINLLNIFFTTFANDIKVLPASVFVGYKSEPYYENESYYFSCPFYNPAELTGDEKKIYDGTIDYSTSKKEDSSK